jgi:hypothetical protein
VLLARAGLAYQGQLGMWATPGDAIALDLMNEALVGLGDEHEVIRARTSAAIAHGHVLTAGDVGLRSADDAVALARASGDASALCSALTARAWSVRGRLPVVERRAAAEELVAAGRTFGLRTYEQAGLYLLGSELLNAADLDGADEVFASSSAGFAGLPSERWGLVNFRSSRAFAEGRYRDGDALAAEAHELGAYLGDTNETVDALRIMYTRLEQGELPAAADAFERVEATTFGLTGPFRARMDVESGDLDAGRIALGAWMDPVFDQLPGLLHCFAAAQAVLVAGRLGDVERAIVLGEFLTLFRGELIGNDAWIYAAADHLVGLCAATAGRLDDAVELMRSGHAMHERLGLHARVAQSGLDLGRVLLARDQPGDRESGETHIRHTVALAEQLGMIPCAREAASLL